MMRAYYYKTITLPIDYVFIRWFINLAYYGLLSYVPWTPDNPRACFTVLACFFAFLTLCQLLSKFIISEVNHGYMYGEIDVSRVKSLKKFLTDLLDDDGIIIA